MKTKPLAYALVVSLAMPGVVAAQTVTRAVFTPPVLPASWTNTVKFEATITGNPTSVVFTYNGANRPLSDGGTNGDAVTSNGVWTTSFTAAEVFAKNVSNRIHRPSMGQLKPAGGLAYNVFAEVCSPSVGLVAVRPVDAGVQETDYIVNYAATLTQITNFNAAAWAQRFYQTHADRFDFLNFVFVGGRIGNRYHVNTRSAATGIGGGTNNQSALFGSAGRLMGYNVFPISAYFDGGETAFSHETGHQWIQSMNGTAFSAGIPHWPRGNVAINVMGFSIGGTGGQGGTYNYTFASNAAGGYVVGPSAGLIQSTFNSLELYLMGLVPTSDVTTYFVLTNQNQNITNGQILAASEIQHVTIGELVGSLGPRVPDAATAQKHFRCATIVLSEQLLDVNAMSLYDWFARRCEAKQMLNVAAGLVAGSCNPWFLATGGRSIMFSRITDEHPGLVLAAGTNGLPQFDFIARHGIRYRTQTSSNLVNWSDLGAPLSLTLTNPPADTAVSMPVDPGGDGSGCTCFRMAVEY